MTKVIELNTWYKKWVYYVGFIFLAMLVIGIVKGIIEGLHM